jgi:hypothetical protein
LPQSKRFPSRGQPGRQAARLARRHKWSLQFRQKSRADVERDIPAHYRASVTYQASDASEKEWRGWYTDDDTEDSLEKRTRTILGILGSWRRLSFWRDHEGVRIVMTNKRKEVELRYKTNENPEVKEMVIYEEDTPQSVIERSGRKGNVFVVDSMGNPFGKTDGLFRYATGREAPPVTIMHGSGMSTMKNRNPTVNKDNRIGI